MKQNWKFLIIGITGDLSKRKILPALSQFSVLNQEKVEIELHGYSRSEPNHTEISDILSLYSSDSDLFKSIHFAQGDYDDPAYFQNLIEKQLTSSERLIVYFAVPPIVFLNLLETFCPYYKANLDILIEKPFGRDLEEAKKILQKIKECKLENNIHFCDHYLFKPALEVNENILEKLQELSTAQIKEIKIKALESLDVNGRGGYYDEIGSIKDMLPAHIFSFWEFLKEKVLLEETIDLEIENIELGQYKGYLEDVEKESSKTETYFKIFLNTNKNFKLILESGKKLKEKKTEIEILFENQNQIIWNIDPKKEIKIIEEKEKVYSLSNSEELDHTRIFSDLLNHKNERFFKASNTSKGWELYEKVINWINSNHPELKIYK